MALIERLLKLEKDPRRNIDLEPMFWTAQRYAQGLITSDDVANQYHFSTGDKADWESIVLQAPPPTRMQERRVYFDNVRAKLNIAINGKNTPDNIRSMLNIKAPLKEKAEPKVEPIPEVVPSLETEPKAAPKAKKPK